MDFACGFFYARSALSDQKHYDIYIERETLCSGKEYNNLQQSFWVPNRKSAQEAPVHEKAAERIAIGTRHIWILSGRVVDASNEPRGINYFTYIGDELNDRRRGEQERDEI